MVTFLIALFALIAGFFIYSKIVDNFFKPTDKPTPAITKKDGVDFVPLPTWKVFMIQLLNIAGLGPIFGALGGAIWGPTVYIWIVLGTIFAGGVHDYLSGMISMREGGKSMSEIVGKYLGGAALTVMRIFLTGLMVLVGTVFTVGPAGLLQMMTGMPLTTLIVMILAYYFLATLLPIDKIIGRLYPIFGICFIFMALGIMFGMLSDGSAMPEMQLANLHPKELPIWPLMFVTVACGAVSGFHSTQSPIMARCVTNEHLARPIFYGAMVAEGIIALIWAAAGITFFHGTAGLNEVLSANGPGAVVYKICEGFMGSGLGMVLAMIGVIACPITSGDTSLRSARLILSDWFNLAQDKLPKRLVLSVPIIICAGLITQFDYSTVWRYFAWSNQTVATIVLWTGAVYMSQKMQGKAFLVALVPAIFMTAVTMTYILVAPEGFQLHSAFCTIAGIVIAALFTARFRQTQNISTRPRLA
ncbi:MAG: carbon starvation protein A [Selenomonadaceae bacterium]|nr:carbon starvation protein A [Selenomonadaceae bacterium]